ncbi:MAG: lipid IV(A) 3-deoxy-D-manno-octulosonic acid transferase [Gemmatimonadota bacterium]
MARWLYTLGWYCALPLAAVYLAWRAIRQRDYLRHWGERFFGRGPAPAGAPVIWLHAVSVGETRAAQPLVEVLAREHPQAHFVLTHMTPTGRAAGESIVRALPGRVVQRYLPYDLPSGVRRFLRETRPAVGVLMETELWPNLLHGAQRAGISVLLVNARLSEKSAAKAKRYAALIRPAGAHLARVAAQSAGDRDRLARFYDGPIDVLGNLKFDLAPLPQLVEQGRQARSRWGARPVWLAASTREGEEALILDMFARLRPTTARLLIVPRHPQRFDEVARLIAERGFVLVRRSSPAWDAPGDDAVLLGDSMGEMALYYAAADVALIGGSLLPFGAQNLIESCAVGTPVVLGPSTFNFAQAAADALAAGAALQAPDANAALAAMDSLTRDADRLQAMRAAALNFAAAHRGATARTAAMVGAFLAASPPVRRFSAPAAG